MPNLASAKKAHRVSLRRNKINTRVRNTYKEARRAVIEMVTAGKLAEAEELMPKAYSKIDMAVKKGVIHKNTGSRYKSRLAQMLAKAQSK